MCSRHQPTDGADSDVEQECTMCGSTSTIELSDEHQTITVCAVCGSDE
jgi:hypothetical protein